MQQRRRLKCTIWSCFVRPSVRLSSFTFHMFDFFSETAERNSMKLDRQQHLNVFYQVCVYRADRKNKLAAPAPDWLSHFRLLLRNQWTEFNETWKEARSQCLLPSLCFSGWSGDRKEEILLSPMTKAHTPTEMSKGQSHNTNSATKNFDYTATVNRLRTVSWSNYSHPAGVVNRFTGPPSHSLEQPSNQKDTYLKL